MMHPATPEIAARYSLRKTGSRYSGPCPKCGGSATTDRFVLFADGGFKCFSCDFRGDRIKWLREMEGMSCKEAHDHEGKGCAVSCPNYGPCRDGQPVTRRTRSVAAPPSPLASGVPLTADALVDGRWLAWAEGLAAKARFALAKEPDHIAWLAARGIDATAIDQHGLGWLSHDQRIDRAAIGLSLERDGKTKLWIPAGLVIPIKGQDGRVQQIRIRRTPESRERFLPDRKYNEIEGGAKEPMVLGSLTGHRGVVVVEAELDAIAVASRCPEVLVIALRSVANGVPRWLHRLLVAAPVILVALDADPPKDDKEGAGSKSVRRWTTTYRQARFWPVPAGKDPGDYVKDHGGDLRAWILVGLPPMISSAAPSLSSQSPSLSSRPQGEISSSQSTAPAPAQVILSSRPQGEISPSTTAPAPHQDGSFSPDCSQRGEGGVAIEGVEEEYAVLTLADGMEICLTSNEALWQRLNAEGLLVFSHHELARLQAALVGMDAEEKAAAIARVIEAKQIFPGAYVRRGEVCA